MPDQNDDRIKRVAIELDRLDQEVRTLQRLLGLLASFGD
jgi:hypothetical protein